MFHILIKSIQYTFPWVKNKNFTICKLLHFFGIFNIIYLEILSNDRVLDFSFLSSNYCIDGIKIRGLNRYPLKTYPSCYHDIDRLKLTMINY